MPGPSYKRLGQDLAPQEVEKAACIGKGKGSDGKDDSGNKKDKGGSKSRSGRGKGDSRRAVVSH